MAMCHCDGISFDDGARISRRLARHEECRCCGVTLFLLEIIRDRRTETKNDQPHAIGKQPLSNVKGQDTTMRGKKNYCWKKN